MSTKDTEDIQDESRPLMPSSGQNPVLKSNLAKARLSEDLTNSQPKQIAFRNVNHSIHYVNGTEVGYLTGTISFLYIKS